MVVQTYKCGNRVTTQLLVKRLRRQGLDVKDPERKGPVWIVKAKDPQERNEKTPEVKPEDTEPEDEPKAPEDQGADNLSPADRPSGDSSI